MAPSDKHRPVFVLCCARSGSTLLRYILDTHPLVCCPPELHLGLLVRQLFWVYANTSGFRAQEGGDAAKLKAAVSGTRQTVCKIMDDYVKRRNKQMWCEKSIGAIDSVDLIQAVFPEARYLCLYRQGLDVVRSGIEALVNDPSGQGFGFAPYLARCPNSRVNGLIDYWCETAGRIIQFEKSVGLNGFRLKYEDIVLHPGETLPGLFQFLEMDWDENLIDSIFSAPHDLGPGDGKIHSTNKIHEDRIGGGSNLPMNEITKDRIVKMNALLQQLGYETVS